MAYTLDQFCSDTHNDPKAQPLPMRCSRSPTG